jgi:hypothetical protein
MPGTTIAKALLLAACLAAGAACGHPEDCPEPCPANHRCNYGACVPIHEAGTEDAADDDDGTSETP